jgi:branched-chain amino acid transport system substrate-binding protein
MSRVRSSLFSILVLLVILTSAACGKQAEPAAGSSGEQVGEPYKIGFLAAITGSAASLGEPERDVAVMLQKQLDAQGGILGADGKRHPIQILIYDTEGSGDVAITVAKKLIDDEKVLAIIGPTRSPVAMALIPIMERAEVPLIAMASSSEIVEPIGERKWIFKVAQSNEHTAPWQVQYVVEKGLLKIANVYVDNAYGEDGARAIRETAAAEGVEIVLEDTFADADTDMTAQITKIKASEAQAVLVTGLPPAAAIFTKQYRELGAQQPLIHNSGVAMPVFITLSGAENAEGVLFPMGKLVAAEALGDDDPQKPILQQFIKDFTAETGKGPSSFAGHAWDSVMILTKVLEKMPAGLSLAEQRAAVRDGVEQLTGFVGVDGVFRFSADDHVGLSTEDVVLVRIRDGAWEYFPPEQW